MKHLCFNIYAIVVRNIICYYISCKKIVMHKGKINMGLSTAEIEKKYHITRQTLYNWMKKGLLSRPTTGKNNKFNWLPSDEKNILDILTAKQMHKRLIEKSDNEYLLISNRRYLGSKQKLLPFILNIVKNHTSNVKIVADIFGGTGVVAHAFYTQGMQIIINDILHSNVISYDTWFGSAPVNEKKIKKYIKYLNQLSPTTDNYVSINFGGLYFSNENARKIGLIREEIENLKVSPRERSILLTSLLYAMDKVANTVGHYDAYRKKMDSFTPIYLKVPKINYYINNNKIYNMDANELVEQITPDLIYIDTPYNSRQYSDAYHLLENIIDWKFPKVYGVAKKMDRSHIKSSYSTQKAPEAFADLISKITAKYILVSYNNMAQKGNGRSNSKISETEIIDILKSRGSVQIFEQPFQAFTTGKTHIDNHKEILYLCTVTKSSTSNKFIKSAINYTGGKAKLLNQILPLFPKDIHDFYDLFAGGANVALNVKNNGRLFINDINTNIIQLYKFLSKSNISNLLTKISKLINDYQLSETDKYGYSFYNANSSQGLKDVNQKNYEKLRKDFNNHTFKNGDKWIAFYVLITFAFNNQIRFNNMGQFNMPVGKRDFNINMKNKLCQFIEALKSNDIVFTASDFRKYKNHSFSSNDFVYIDPPYLLSIASYNENGGWSEDDEIDLLNFLTDLDNKNIRFALSNVLVHKGKTNYLLKEWAKQYKIHYLNHNYNNSNYQSTASKQSTIEVLITNY